DPPLRAGDPGDREYLGGGEGSQSGSRGLGTDHTPARLWDATTGKQIAVLLPPEGGANRREETLCCAFSSDGRYVVTGHLEGGVNLWDARNGKHLRARNGDERRRDPLTHEEAGRRLRVLYRSLSELATWASPAGQGPTEEPSPAVGGRSPR